MVKKPNVAPGLAWEADARELLSRINTWTWPLKKNQQDGFYAPVKRHLSRPQRDALLATLGMTGIVDKLTKYVAHHAAQPDGDGDFDERETTLIAVYFGVMDDGKLTQFYVSRRRLRKTVVPGPTGHGRGNGRGDDAAWGGCI